MRPRLCHESNLFLKKFEEAVMGGGMSNPSLEREVISLWREKLYLGGVEVEAANIAAVFVPQLLFQRLRLAPVSEGRHQAARKREFKLPWRKAGLRKSSR